MASTSIRTRPKHTVAPYTLKATPLRIALLGMLVLAALAVAGSAGTAQAIIDNGEVQLGIVKEGALNLGGGLASCGGALSPGTGTVGLRYMPTNCDSTSPGCLCEGWGIAYDGLVSGYCNMSVGCNLATLSACSFVSTSSTAHSTCTIGDLRVTHDYEPSLLYPILYQARVTVENTNPVASHADLTYRRVADWDVEPTPFNDFVTIQGAFPIPPEVKFFNDNGFSAADPLVAPGGMIGACGLPTTYFVDCGPNDHGFLLDLEFGTIGAGATLVFHTFFGAAPDEPSALAALTGVGATWWTLGQCTPILALTCSPTAGTPNTFIYAYGGPGTPTAEPARPRTLPLGRESAASAYVGNKLYVSHGNNWAVFGPNANANAQAFDPVTDSWEVLPSAHHIRNEVAGVAYDGRYFAIGGSRWGMENGVDNCPVPVALAGGLPIANPGWTVSTGPYAWTTSVDHYIWTNGPNVYDVETADSNWAGACALVESFDPATHTWTDEADLLVRRTAAVAATYYDPATGDPRLLVAGGRDIGAAFTPATLNPWSVATAMDSVEIYDGTAWSAGPSMNQNRSDAAVAVLSGEIWVIGGWDHTTGGSTTVEVFDGSSWSAGPPLPSARASAVAGVCGGRIYLAGGYAGGAMASNPPLDDVLVYDPGVGAWAAADDLPRTGFRFAGHGVAGPWWQSIHAVGTGREAAVQDGGGNDVQHYVFDCDAGWRAGDDQPLPASGRSGAFVGDRFVTSHGMAGVGGITAAAAAYDPVQNIWSPLPPALTPRVHAAAASTGRTYVVVGGSCGGSVCSSVESLDLQAMAWSPLTSMPTARSGLGAAALGGKIYAIGGRDSSMPFTGNALQVVEIYDVASSSWSSGPSLPRPLSDFATTTTKDGRIVVAGGWCGPTCGGGMSQEVFVLHPEIGGWISYPPLPNPIAFGLAAECNDVLHVMGGVSAAMAPTADVHWLDSATFTWTTGPPMLTPAAEMANGQAASRGDFVMVVGPGFATGDHRTEVYRCRDGWHEDSPLANHWAPPTALAGAGGAVVGDGGHAGVREGAAAFLNGEILLTHGYTANTLSGKGVSYDPRKEEWNAIASTARRRSDPAAVAYGGEMWVLGGEVGIPSFGAAGTPGCSPTSLVCNTVESYDPITDSWTARPSMPTARAGLSAVAIGPRIFAMGGRLCDHLHGWSPPMSAPSCTSATDVVEVFDGTVWSTLPPMPRPRTDAMAAVFLGQIWVMGGWDPAVGFLDAVDIYDPFSGLWISGPALPLAKADGVAAICAGNLIVAGGREGWVGSDYLGTRWVHRVRPLAPTSWGPMPSAPAPIAGAAGAAAEWPMESTLYIMGNVAHYGAGQYPMAEPAGYAFMWPLDCE